jgi:hypothetical protein
MKLSAKNKGTIINRTNSNVPIVRKDGGCFMLSPKSKLVVNLDDLEHIPASVTIKK